MFLSDLEFELYDHFGHGDNPPSEVVTRFRRNINTAYKEILGMKGLSKLRRKTLTFVSVAQTPFAVLPQAAARIITIHDRVNQVTLDEISLQDVRFDDPGLASSSGVPYGYVILNLAAAVARDPTAAAELFVKSTSAADGAGVNVRLQGIITGGYEQTTVGPMNGVTATTVDASITSWLTIQRFNLSNLAKGVVTLLQGSGVGTELARIPIGKASAKYTQIQLHPVPTAALTYYADVDLNVPDMTDPNDEPVFHEDFHWLLSCGAMKREYQKREKSAQFAVEDKRWKSGIGDLKLFVQRKSGVGNQPSTPIRHSQLGPYYRPGT